MPISKSELLGGIVAFIPIVSTISGTIQAFYYYKKLKGSNSQNDQQIIGLTAKKVKHVIIPKKIYILANFIITIYKNTQRYLAMAFPIQIVTK